MEVTIGVIGLAIAIVIFAVLEFYNRGLDCELRTWWFNMNHRDAKTRKNNHSSTKNR